MGTRNELYKARWFLDYISDKGKVIFEVKYKKLCTEIDSKLSK